MFPQVLLGAYGQLQRGSAFALKEVVSQQGLRTVNAVVERLAVHLQLLRGVGAVGRLQECQGWTHGVEKLPRPIFQLLRDGVFAHRPFVRVESPCRSTLGPCRLFRLAHGFHVFVDGEARDPESLGQFVDAPLDLEEAVALEGAHDVEALVRVQRSKPG